MNFCVLGKQISYSLSPFLHGELFSLQGRQDSYGIFDGEIPDFMKELHNYDGFNITIPHKQAIIPYLDELSPEAKYIGAVNTVKKVDGKLIGYNTDCMGIEYTLNNHGFACKGKSVLVLGNGGAALAAIYVLKKLGAAHIYIKGRGKEVDFCEKTDTLVFTDEYDKIDGIINATPVGTKGKEGEFPVMLDCFTALSWCFDMVYNPLVTKMKFFCIEYGVPCAMGVSMFAAQGVYANEIWTDASPQLEHIPLLIDKLQQQLVKQTVGTQSLFLCGFMAAGKTTMGKALADYLGFSFLDTDQEIEKQSGMTISQLFQQQGELSFRKLEQGMANQFPGLQKTVVSLGGGFILNEGVLPLINQVGKLIFIDTPYPVIEQRLQADVTRPLASNCKELYGQRYDIYKKSATVVFQPSCTDILTDTIQLAQLL